MAESYSNCAEIFSVASLIDFTKISYFILIFYLALLIKALSEKFKLGKFKLSEKLKLGKFKLSAMN
jgi:hypothetical protein